MKIVQGDQMPIDEEASNVRAGKLKKQVFLAGNEGTPGNFRFGLFYQTGDFYSPRHRHNFDQFRFQIEGDAGFDRNGTMLPDSIGYFPEGAYYGPQSSTGSNVVAVVQFGGPSGSGYLSQRQVNAAYEEMKKFGVFDKGVYRRNEGVTGQKNMDSFQATWEYANQRPMVYPKPQYADPILMTPAHFRWMPLPGASGVEVKTSVPSPTARSVVRVTGSRLAPVSPAEGADSSWCCPGKARSRASRRAGTPPPISRTGNRQRSRLKKPPKSSCWACLPSR